MENKFLVDFMLGRLARWLRILGFDAAYYTDREKEGIIYRSLKEKRIVLTRDSSLSRRKALGLYRVKSEDFRRQLGEVIEEYNLKINKENMFSRCPECNTQPQQIEKEQIKGEVPPYIFKTHNRFSRCPGCGKIYWQGTHKKLVDRVLSGAGLDENI